MTDSTTPTTAWTRLAAPLPRLQLVTGFASRHPPKGPVAPPLFPFVVRRRASTMRAHAAAAAAESII